MNSIEKELVSTLTILKHDFGAIAVKASMEAEGIYLSEMLRLKIFCMSAGVGLSVKIGGCEALTDARIAKSYDVSILMSPMIESRFALEKFLDMAALLYPGEERNDVKFHINIETLDGYNNIDAILEAENISLLDTIVLGRTDLRSALKVAHVDCPEVLKIAREVFIKAKQKFVRGVIGGGISENTIPFLEALEGLTCGFETRKVVFGHILKERELLREAIRQSLRFEYLWYQLRQETYLSLSREDEDKIKKFKSILF